MKNFTILCTIFLLPLAGKAQTEAIDNQLPENLWHHYNPFAYQSETWVNDSIYCYAYNDMTGETNPSTRTYNKEFTPFGALLHAETQIWDNGSWVNVKRIENSFDELGVLEMQRELSWNTTTQGWYYKERSLFEYASNGQFSKLTIQVFDNDAQAWNNKSQNVYTYSTFNRPDEFLAQKWENGAWLNDYRVSYTHNSAGLESSSNYQKWNPASNDWENVNRTFTTFDANGYPYQTKRETWAAGSMSYRNSSRSTYTYNNQNLLENTLNESWNPSDSVWSITGDQVQYYDGEARLLELIARNWNGVNMVNYFRFIRNYNSEGNLILQKNELFVNGNWRLIDYCDFYYSLETFIPTNEIPFEICKFPNPVSPGQMLFCNAPNLVQADQWILTNLSGRLVQRGNHPGQIELNTDLPQGIYLLTFLKDGKFYGQNKLLVQP